MTILDPMDRETTQPPGITPALGAVLVALTVLMHAGDVDGPLRDGQGGNCGAMFSLFARNVEAVGWVASSGVPIVNPVPPAAGETAVYYAHHPPGLPWLVSAGSALSGEPIVGPRLLALLLTLCSVWLMADVVSRAAGRGAGLAAGALLAALPSGWHHGLLVNYETIALPPLLLVVRVVLFGRGSALLAGALAGLADYIALVPLGLSVGVAFGKHERRRGWWVTLAAGLAVLVIWSLASRRVAPGSLAETLAQAVATTPFAPDFTWPLWLDAARSHLGALFGWALVPAALGLVVTLLRGGIAARLVALLAAVGAFNVVVFGRHAIGHEHFWLLLAPAVAAAIATLVPTTDERSGRIGRVALVGAVLALSAHQAREAAPARHATRQSDLGHALATLAPLKPDAPTVYVTPNGAPLVFLSAAERHVASAPVGDVATARAVAGALRSRLGLPAGDVALVLPADQTTPAWATDLEVVARSAEVTLRAVPAGD